MNRLVLRAAVLLAAFVMMLLVGAGPTAKAEQESAGEGLKYVTIEGNASYNSGELTIMQAGNKDFDIRIEGVGEGKSSTHIVVKTGKGQITLTNVNIEIPDTYPYSYPALLIESGCEVTLVLDGDNTLTSMGDSFAGLQVEPGATLTIMASPSPVFGKTELTAKGGKNGAGIGGGEAGDASNITIESGTIEAESSWGAGIGGGKGGPRLGHHNQRRLGDRDLQ